MISAGADGRLFVTLPVDRGRWARRPGPGPAFKESDETASSDGRWIARSSGLGSPETAFQVDLGGLSLTQTARLTVLRASDRIPVADKAELPVEPGEKSLGAPVFSADSSMIAMQVATRAVLWDLAAMLPVDAGLPLPPGTRLVGAEAEGAGWLASAGPSATEHYAFDANPAAWSAVACKLAGGPMTVTQWKRYLGDQRAFAPACR